MQTFKRRACAVISIGGLALTIGVAGAARGDDRSDSKALMSVYERSLALTGDINDSIRGALAESKASGDFQIAQCLSDLRDAVATSSVVLDDVNNLALVTSLMEDPADARTARTIRDVSAESARQAIARDRRSANEAAGSCPNQLLVQNRARDLIQLLDDATGTLSALKAPGN